MGLSLSVGLLADLARTDAEAYDYHRQAFARLVDALRAEGIDWHEPDNADPPAGHTFAGGFPYGYLTQLRRLLVLTNLGEPVTPAAAVSGERYERDCEKVQDETAMLASHLLCHADDSGYYLPVDFGDPLFLSDEDVEGGGMVGSSQRLLAELTAIAASMGTRTEPGEPFETERFAWDQLHRACLASIAGGHAIVFR